MRVYAVFDTNVLVSSLLTKTPSSATARVVNAIYEEKLTPLYTEEIISEYEDVLRRDKFSFSDDAISRILLMIRQYGVSVSPSHTGEIYPIWMILCSMRSLWKNGIRTTHI